MHRNTRCSIMKGSDYMSMYVSDKIISKAKEVIEAYDYANYYLPKSCDWEETPGREFALERANALFGELVALCGSRRKATWFI